MLYFIPAWYQNNQWCENEQSWYERRMRTEFDDTVKQIQLFHRSKAYAYRILLLAYAPNFRHFLHRQSVYHAPYWSCFDAIQEVQGKKATALSIHSLNWPDDIEYLHTPFVMLAMCRGRKYAQIEFGEDGNPIRIDLYRGEQVIRRNIYDDRGFLSSSIVYKQDAPFYQEYLTAAGVWKMRCYLRDGHVEINPACPEYLLETKHANHRRKFHALQYESMDLVIEEVFFEYVRLMRQSDVYCIAVHELHMKVLGQVLKAHKTILSFFQDRYEPSEHYRIVLSMLEEANYIITDSVANTELVCRLVRRKLDKIMDITPYDSRVDFGISQQLNVQKILVPVDGLAEDLFARMVALLGEYLTVNANARVHLFTRQAAYDRSRRLLEKTRKYLEDASLESGWAAEPRSAQAENGIDAGEDAPIRFFVEQCVDELAVSKCMREQRLLVELRKIPELYLQISAISMGIPQVVRTDTQYVEDKKNGIILKALNELPQALAFYLDGMSNWNQAMIASYELGKKFTTSVLIDKWREVLEFVG